jgi:hypothetical protein
MTKSSNKKKIKTSYADRKKLDPFYFKNRKLLERYKISLEEFEKILRSQKNLCAICSRFMNGADQLSTPYLDHNHKTQMVRGILCLNCNTLLSHAKENVGILKIAIDYLNEHRNP